MNNILKHLYYGNLNESARSTKELQETKEYKKYDECYEKLIATFSKEQKDLFEKYFEAKSLYISIEKERIYANGIKTGMSLTLELMNFEPTTC